MTAKRPPWLMIWARYLLVLFVVGVVALCRRIWPALRAFGGALAVIGSLPFKLLDAHANRQMERIAEATVRQSETQAYLAAIAQQQAMLQNAYGQHLQAMGQTHKDYLAMLMNQQNVTGLYEQFLAQGWQPPPPVQGQFFYPSSPHDAMKAYVQRIYGFGP